MLTWILKRHLHSIITPRVPWQALLQHVVQNASKLPLDVVAELSISVEAACCPRKVLQFILTDQLLNLWPCLSVVEMIGCAEECFIFGIGQRVEEIWRANMGLVCCGDAGVPPESCKSFLSKRRWPRTQSFHRFWCPWVWERGIVAGRHLFSRLRELFWGAVVNVDAVGDVCDGAVESGHAEWLVQFSSSNLPYHPQSKLSECQSCPTM